MSGESKRIGSFGFVSAEDITQTIYLSFYGRRHAKVYATYLTPAEARQLAIDLNDLLIELAHSSGAKNEAGKWSSKFTTPKGQALSA